MTIPELLGSLVGEAVAELAPGVSLDGPMAQATADPRHGDYQSNVAFRLNRQLRCAPAQVARSILERLPSHPAVERVDLAGPGFLNFSLATPWLAENLPVVVEDPRFAVPCTGQGRRVVIDYGSPNVAKRMHVGHLRSTNIGAALVELHRAAGWEVIGDNHIGDWGTHFGKLMVAWGLWADQDSFQRDPIGELQRLYERFTREAEDEPAMEERARAETAKLQAGDEGRRALWRRFVDASMSEFERVYERLGVKFDVALGESFYQPMLGPLVDDLLGRGVAEEDEGAVLIRFSEEDGKNLSKSPMLIRKKDGAALYATTDLAALRYREETWQPDRIVYVTDGRQQLHFQQLFAAGGRLGLTGAELRHVWFGVLTLPEGSMSSRKGNVVRLQDLLDQAVERARAVVDEKSPHLSEGERAAIAEAVGTGAVRYADLSQNPQSNVVFDWDRMLALDGNTAPFMMYSYARCRSIQRKAGASAAGVDVPDLGGPLERDLALAVQRFPEAVHGALQVERPNLLCDYLYGLAGCFNRFYYELPVLQAPTAEARTSRLALVEATARVLQAGLGMVGVGPLERM